MPIIYTPTTIWKNFIIQEEPSFISGVRSEENGKIYENGFVEGRLISGERIKIYTQTVKPNKAKMPAVLVFNDYKISQDKTLLEQLADNGYYAVSFDLAGNVNGRQNYTLYPEEINYANLENSIYQQKEINEDITKTCWYEWCLVAKYLLHYVKSLKFVTSVGCLGVNGGATTLWHLLANTEEVDGAVFINNAGWTVYEGKSKFLSENAEGYSDGKLAFVAGIEPQSYANHVKCPTMILSCTNSNDYDLDRAYDTLTRIGETQYRNINYAVNRRGAITKQTFTNAFIFFERYLVNRKNAQDLPGVIDIECTEGSTISVKATVTAKNLKCVELYLSEGLIQTSKRCWKKAQTLLAKEGTYEFSISPNERYGFACWFVKAVYKNGYEVCSRVCGKIMEQKKPTVRQNNLIYSSRYENSYTQFGSANEQESVSAIDLTEKTVVSERIGPMKMLGVTSACGLLTFGVMSEKVKPDGNSIIMFDAFVNGGGEITVKLICDYFGAKTEYMAVAKIVGEDIWQNVKLTLSSFKTAEGLPIKKFERIEAVEFSCNGEYLINNALWV